MPFTVVKFDGASTLNVIPSNWLLIEKGSEIGACFMPPNRIEERTKGQQPPDKDKWDLCRVKFVKHYARYDEAIKFAFDERLAASFREVLACKQEIPEMPVLNADDTSHAIDQDCHILECENGTKKVNPPNQRKRVILIQTNVDGEMDDNPLTSATSPVGGYSKESKRMRTNADENTENCLPASTNREATNSMCLTDNSQSTDNKVCNCTKSFLTTVETTLHLLYEGQREQTRLLKQIVSKLAGVPEFGEEDMFHIPLQSTTELDIVAGKLENDKNYRSQVLLHLSRVGGRNARDTVRNIMARVGSPSLWSHFSFMGQRGNQAFRGNPLCNVIIKACMQGNDVTEKEVEVAISDVLRYSKKRFQGREETTAVQEHKKE